jgi:hypothetical protein
VAVGIGEGTGVSPLLIPSFDDDLGASVLRATHQLVDCGIGGQPDRDQTLMRSPRRSLRSPITHPKLCDGISITRNPTLISNCRGSGSPSSPKLAHGHEPEGGVEGVRYQAILDG